MSSDKVTERLGSRLSLPAMPHCVKRVQDLLADPDVRLQDVGRRIAEDPALTARLLRTVNSAYYGLQTEVVLPEHAAAVLGMRGLRNLMSRTPVFSKLRVGELDVRGLWRHSLLSARVCAALRERTRACAELSAQELYVYGLLHNVGELAMLEGFGEKWAQLAVELPGDGAAREVLERERFGTSHGKLGAMLVTRWALPEDFVRVTRFHHNEKGLAEHDPLAACVLVAECMAAVALHERERMLRGIPAATLKLLGLTTNDVGALRDLAVARRAEIPA